MAELNTAVELSLKDRFTAGMKTAAGAVNTFSGKTLGAIKKIDSALSGTASKLAAFGLTLSVGAVTKDIIELDDRLSAIGVQSGLAADGIASLKQQVYDVANAPDVKVDTSSLIDAMDAVIERTGDVEFATSNIRAMGLAMRATGASGADTGGLYAEFQKYGLSAEEVLKTIDTLTVQGKEGAVTLRDLATLGPRTISAYAATGRSGSQAIMEMGAALQVIKQGTGSPEQAATAFEALMRELADPNKIKLLRQLGVQVDWTKKSVMDLMGEIVQKTGGDARKLNTVFGGEAARAFNYVAGQFQTTGRLDILEKFNGIVGDGSTIQRDAAERAQTLSANIQNLQTAFEKFVNVGISPALVKLTDGLNWLAEDPDRLQKVFTGAAIGIGAITAVKGIAGISRLVTSFSSLRGGGKINIAESLTMAQAMPVYVTNWGGMGAGASLPAAADLTPPQTPAQTNPKSTPTSPTTALAERAKPLGAAREAVGGITKAQYAGGAAMGGVTAAVVAIPQMIGELEAIKQDETLTDAEKSKAKGGAIGDATGTIVGGAVGGAAGIAVGAAAGAAIGSVVPILGTAVGALAGAGIGALGMWLGGKAGRAIGEGIGEAVAPDETAAAPAQDVAVNQITAGTVPAPPLVPGSVTNTTYNQATYNQYQQAATPSSYLTGIVPAHIPAQILPPQLMRTETALAPKNVEIGGQAVMDVNVNLSGERPTAQVAVRNNTMPYMRFNTGNRGEAR